MAVMFATGPQPAVARITRLCRHADGTPEAQLELEAPHVTQLVTLH